jgi:hypothetical protein
MKVRLGWVEQYRTGLQAWSASADSLDRRAQGCRTTAAYIDQVMV